jgi:hypothetical protein
MTTRHALRIAACALLFAASATTASAQIGICGGVGTSTPVIKPIIYPSLQFDRSNPGFDCQMWQAFIYLNWPALAGQRGVPNPAAKLGATGTTDGRPTRRSSRPFCRMPRIRGRGASRC